MNSLYILSVQEWKLDQLCYVVLWNPFKWMGRKMSFLTRKTWVTLLIVLYLFGLYANLYPEVVGSAVGSMLPLLFSVVGLMLVLFVFAYRGNGISAWVYLISGQLYITLSIALLNVEFDQTQISFYLSGIIVCGLVGYGCLRKVSQLDNDINLSRFHGYSFEEPVIGLIFLVASLGLVGLPFTPTFIGIDLLFSNIHRHDVGLIVTTAISFVFIELSILRIYTRVFMGQHKKPYHPIAYRSS